MSYCWLPDMIQRVNRFIFIRNQLICWHGYCRISNDWFRFAHENSVKNVCDCVSVFEDWVFAKTSMQKSFMTNDLGSRVLSSLGKWREQKLNEKKKQWNKNWKKKDDEIDRTKKKSTLQIWISWRLHLSLCSRHIRDMYNIFFVQVTLTLAILNYKWIL